MLLALTIEGIFEARTRACRESSDRGRLVDCSQVSPRGASGAINNRDNVSAGSSFEDMMDQ
jgi:hypothetical protein